MEENEIINCKKCGTSYGEIKYCEQLNVLEYHTFPLKGYYCASCWMRLLAFWA